MLLHVEYLLLNTSKKKHWCPNREKTKILNESVEKLGRWQMQALTIEDLKFHHIAVYKFRREVGLEDQQLKAESLEQRKASKRGKPFNEV